MHRKSAVITFIEKERAVGVSDQEIQHQLLDAGWQMDIIHRAMDTKLGQKQEPTPLKPNRKPEINQLIIPAAASILVLLILLALFI